jgi:hypothetical protein
VNGLLALREGMKRERQEVFEVFAIARCIQLHL